MKGRQVIFNGCLSQQSCFNPDLNNHDKDRQIAAFHLLRFQSKSLGVMPAAVKGLGGFSLGEITYLLLALPSEKQGTAISAFIINEG